VDLIVLLIASVGALLLGHLIFRVIRRSYRLHGKLSIPVSCRQIVAVAPHAVIAYIGLRGSPWLILPDSGPQILVGILIGVVGLIVLIRAFVIFGPIGRAFGNRNDELKTAGVYSWSRNPQIVGYEMFLLGWIILWPSLYIVAALIVFMGVAHQMVRVEEEHLARVHGEAYVRYRNVTPRYFGRPRIDV